MTLTATGMQQQIDEALRRTEIDALLKELDATTNVFAVAQLLVNFINFPRVTAAANVKLDALIVAPKARKSRAKA